MSRDRIRAEAEKLQRPGSKVRCVDDGETVIVILEPYALPEGKQYSAESLEALAFRVPVVYPDAAPDPSGFYVKPRDLTVTETKAAPRSSDPNAAFLSETWLKFSWGLKQAPFDPEHDTLETHLAVLETRLRKGD